MATTVTYRRPTWQLSAPPTAFPVLGILAGLTVIGVVAGVTRLLTGMGMTTSLTDSVPWGVWIGFDFALIAFSGAGFTMAFVGHILHLHRFEAAVRPALFAGFLGYVAVLMLLLLDLGRPDRFYNFLLYWNLHSPLFEICWCVLLYATVLVIEVSPDLLDRLGWQRLRRIPLAIMPVVCIIGVTLSTLHQSTLGTLYVNMPHRLNALWYSPFMPVLFFTSSVMAGLSVAIVVYRITVRIHNKDEDLGVCTGLSVGVGGAAVVYLLVKLGLLWWEGKLPLLFAASDVTSAWWLEVIVGVLIPLFLLLIPQLRRQSVVQWVAPLLVILGVGMNRFNATLTGQTPPWNQSAIYSPHLLEWLSTIGILSGVALVWYLAMRYLVKFEQH
ncbi:MAG: polysulfide reductase NrfD [Caldilineaceae bacterium]|nr:polysulfide reductase NrfD [Caldilineaceae bacterium]